MRPAETSKLLLVLGRLIAVAAAAITVALMAWWGYDLLRSVLAARHPRWDAAGVLSFVVVLRMAVAVWVAWSAIRLDGRPLARTLLAAFGVAFFLLFGWYFLLAGMDYGVFYWVVVGDALYLAGGLAVGCALLLPAAGTRSAENRL